MRRHPEAMKLLKTLGAGSSKSRLSRVILKRTARVLQPSASPLHEDNHDAVEQGKHLEACLACAVCSPHDIYLMTMATKVMYVAIQSLRVKGDLYAHRG